MIVTTRTRINKRHRTRNKFTENKSAREKKKGNMPKRDRSIITDEDLKKTNATHHVMMLTVDIRCLMS